MNVIGIVREYLETHGYDGLCTEDCGCGIAKDWKHGPPCDGPMDTCEPACWSARDACYTSVEAPVGQPRPDLFDLFEVGRSVLTGQTVHVYTGSCPSPEDWTARDPECPACRWMVDVEALA
jgi:hypothetical protein